jgi:hypothetical protein
MTRSHGGVMMVRWDPRPQLRITGYMSTRGIYLEWIGSYVSALYLLSAPLTIPLVCCHIKSFRRASSCGEAMARRRKEERRAGIASRGM